MKKQISPKTSGMLSLAALLMMMPTVLSAEELDSAGTKIYYTVEGKGEPVVLIHGYQATGDLNWRLTGVVPLLAKKYQVITLDNRGHGRSGKPRDPKKYGSEMAEDVIRLLDQLQIDRAHLVGYSMGGMIALKVLATHPERVRSAVIGGMGWSDYQALPEGDIPEEKTGIAACRRAFGELGITRQELSAVRTPAVVIMGKDDRLRGRVAALTEIRPDFPVVWIENANHTSCIFRKEFREAIRDFLDQQTATNDQIKL